MRNKEGVAGLVQYNTDLHVHIILCVYLREGVARITQTGPAT